MTKNTRFDVTIEPDLVVSARLYPASTTTLPSTTLILGHGAGASQVSSFMMNFARGLASCGVDVVTFNFVYMERGRRIPDPVPKLEVCYRAVLKATRERTSTTRLIVGGKSLGGRIASQVVAADKHDLDVSGLILLGYPLHPPRRPDKKRDSHLPKVSAPMLFVQGSLDTFGTPHELRPVLATCRSASLHVVKGGDHSFKVGGKRAPSLQQVWKGVQDVVITWLSESRSQSEIESSA